MTSYDAGSLSVEKPKNTEFGDFAVNVSGLARFARLSPIQIAQEIVSNLNVDNCEISVVGGFVNFKVGADFLKELIAEIFEQKEKFGKPEKMAKEKILLEYVSANPTGPFHIGHGRWAAMGSALANLLKFYGHDVTQEFYINDAGSQIDKLGKSLEIRIKQELGEKADFPTDEVERKNYYTGEYLIPIAKKFLKENTPHPSPLPQGARVPLDVKILATYTKEEMENLQKALLKEFRVDFDIFYSESDLHNSGKVDACVEKLKKMEKLKVFQLSYMKLWLKKLVLINV